MLRLPDLAVGTEPLELLVNTDDLLEVKLLKVNVEPPHQEVDEVPLLQLVVSEAAESLQHLRKVPVEVVEGAHSPNALPVLSYSFHVSRCALELSLELLGAQAHRRCVGDSQNFADEELNCQAPRVLLFSLHRTLVQAEESRYD